MHDAEAGDETAHEGVIGHHPDADVLMQQRIEGPHSRPGNDGEEDPRLEAVEREKEGDRHADGDFNGIRCSAGLGPASGPNRRQAGGPPYTSLIALDLPAAAAASPTRRSATPVDGSARRSTPP